MFIIDFISDQVNDMTVTKYKIPAEMRALMLDGNGFEHLQVRKVSTPRPARGQMLARVDAAGICTSLIKLVEQGSDHPLIYGWDLGRFYK